MSKSSPLNSRRRKNKKNILIKENGMKCAICNQNFTYDELTIDHIIPWSISGCNSMYNLQLACSKCNQSKGNKEI